MNPGDFFVNKNLNKALAFLKRMRDVQSWIDRILKSLCEQEIHNHDAESNFSKGISISTKRGMGGVQYNAAVTAKAINPRVETIRAIFQWDMKILLSMVT